MSSNVRSATIGWSTTALGPHDAPITGHILLWKLLSDDRDAEGAEERKSDGPAAVPDHLEVEDYDRSLEVKTGALQHAVTGLQHSSTYIFAVQTFNMVGQSPVSPPSAPVQTQYKPHAAPSAPRLSGRFARRLELEWDEPVCTDDRVVRCVCACAPVPLRLCLCLCACIVCRVHLAVRLTALSFCRRVPGAHRWVQSRVAPCWRQCPHRFHANVFCDPHSSRAAVGARPKLPVFRAFVVVNFETAARVSSSVTTSVLAGGRHQCVRDGP